MSRKASYTNDELKIAIEQSDSWSGVLRHLNLKIAGGTQSHIIKKAKQLGFDNSHLMGHFKGQGWSKGKLAIEDSRIKSSKNVAILFTENSLSAIPYMRIVLRKYNLIPYKCECDNSGEWRDKELKLQLHHRNGIRNDNRLNNLQWLCPNCHSQTDTYGGKNVKAHISSVSNDELKNALKSTPNIHQALIKVGLNNGRNYKRAKLLKLNLAS